MIVEARTFWFQNEMNAAFSHWVCWISFYTSAYCMYSVGDCILVLVLLGVDNSCASAQSFSVRGCSVWIVFNISMGIGTSLVL